MTGGEIKPAHFDLLMVLELLDIEIKQNSPHEVNRTGCYFKTWKRLHNAAEDFLDFFNQRGGLDGALQEALNPKFQCCFAF